MLFLLLFDIELGFEFEEEDEELLELELDEELDVLDVDEVLLVVESAGETAGESAGELDVEPGDGDRLSAGSRQHLSSLRASSNVEERVQRSCVVS